MSSDSSVFICIYMLYVPLHASSWCRWSVERIEKIPLTQNVFLDHLQVENGSSLNLFSFSLSEKKERLILLNFMDGWTARMCSWRDWESCPIPCKRGRQRERERKKCYCWQWNGLVSQWNFYSLSHFLFSLSLYHSLDFFLPSSIFLFFEFSQEERCWFFLPSLSLSILFVTK